MKHQMACGAIVDTEKARKSWQEAKRWNGSNHISVNTGSQWEHETLFLSAKGRYYLVHDSQWQGSLPSAEFISEVSAARWLIANDEELPEGLKQFAEVIEE